MSAADPKSESRGTKTEARGFSVVRAKGLKKKARTADNLEAMYQGALDRLAWIEKKLEGEKMPTELEQAGTVVTERLEGFGTLAGLIARDENGEPIQRAGSDGYDHVVSTPFARGPRMVEVPKRLHLEGQKRQSRPDGTTVPYHIDMTGPRPDWWRDRQRRKLERAASMEGRPVTARGPRKPKRARTA
jgi:hypothetical protein